MNHQLNHMLARQHIADLQRNADRARRAREVVPAGATRATQT